jgi:hypothetical protein
MVQKSDAMIQYEKSAGELMKNRPKHSNDSIMHLEVRNFVVAAAGLFAILVIATTMMGF